MKTCLESTDPNLVMKIVDLYEAADATVEPKMEKVLATKWKVVEDPTLTRDKKVQAIRTSLLLAAASAKISPEERLAKVETYSVLSAQGGREVEFLITVREYVTPKDPAICLSPPRYRLRRPRID